MPGRGCPIPSRAHMLPGASPARRAEEVGAHRVAAVLARAESGQGRCCGEDRAGDVAQMILEEWKMGFSDEYVRTGNARYERMAVVKRIINEATAACERAKLQADDLGIDAAGIEDAQRELNEAFVRLDTARFFKDMEAVQEYANYCAKCCAQRSVLMCASEHASAAEIDVVRGLACAIASVAAAWLTLSRAALTINMDARAEKLGIRK